MEKDLKKENYSEKEITFWKEYTAKKYNEAYLALINGKAIKLPT